MIYSCILTEVKHVPVAEYCIKKSNDKQIESFLWDPSILHFTLMGVWAFILCNRHRWDIKQKNKNHVNISSRFSLNRNQRSLLLYIICVQYTRFWLVFGSINICTNCQFIWLGKLYIWLPVWEFMSQQAHACWELKYLSPSTLLVCGHFIQIHSCKSICFWCTYNYKHFHKWFCIF